MFFSSLDPNEYKKHYWKCKECGRSNDIETSDCSYCKYGIDPDVERDKVHDNNFKIMSVTFIALVLLAIGVYFIVN